MRKTILFIAFVFINVLAFAQGFTVNGFTTDIYLNSEGYFDVVEKYDIELAQAKHGIFREIITDYKLNTTAGRTENRHLVIQNIEVPTYPFEVNSKLEQRTDEKIFIKIGDKDRLVTGLQHYEIKYRVYNAFLFDDEQVQFYWNVKPSGWQALFRQVTLRIHVPEGTGLSAENCFVYAGDTGTSQPSADFDYGYSNGTFSAKSHAFFFSMPGQDVTVLLQLPRHTIQENFITVPFWQRYSWVGILGFLLVAFWLVWLRYGKDERVISVTSYYPPNDIDPAMAGYLIDDKDDASDLIALIPHWASQGYIMIEEIPKSGIFGKADMKLTRLSTIPVTSPDYEQRLFSTLFGIWGNHVLISSLSNTFYVTMGQAKKELKAQAQKYYEAKSNEVMKITMGVAIALGVVLCGLFLFTYGPLAAISAPIICVFIAFMTFFLQKKNSQGNVVFSELKGFRQFIKLAEVNRIKVLLEQDPAYFEKTMSYALAFGLLDKWAKKFDALHIPPPTWYHSSGTRMIDMYAFSKSFSVSMAVAQSSMVSSPSSSSSGGGGSSGGGFGGGGGGSW